MESAPLISVVVPTHAGGARLLRCLERLEPNRPGVELIIIDNASGDGSVARAAEVFPGARIVENRVNEGFARACNQGAAASHGEFVLFLNDDAFIDPPQLETLIHAASEDAAAAVWQPVNVKVDDGQVESAGDAFTWWGFFARIEDRPAGAEPRSVFAAKGACLLVRRELFDRLGGFQADYFAYFEESDLCWRARLAGFEVRVVPNVTIEHIGGGTSTRVLSPSEIRYLSFRNRVRTILANSSGVSLWRIVPLHMVGCLCFVVLFVLTGRIRSAAAVIAAVSWPLLHMGETRSQRRRAQALRVLADARVIRRDLVSPITPSLVARHLTQQIFRWERSAAVSKKQP